MKKLTAWVVEDNLQYAEMLCYVLNQTGFYQAKPFYTVHSCIDALALEPDLLILDYHLSTSINEKNGNYILNYLKQQNSSVTVILLSGQDNINIAIEAIKKGVYDYIIKNDFALSKVTLAAQNIAEMKQLLDVNYTLIQQVKQHKLKTILLVILLFGFIFLHVLFN